MSNPDRPEAIPLPPAPELTARCTHFGIPDLKRPDYCMAGVRF